MNNYKKLLEKFFLLLSSFSYPAFIFDSHERIIKMNPPLKRIIEKTDTRIREIKVNTVLRMNGFDIKFKKVQLSRDGISVLKHKNQKVMHISMLTENDLYVGGMMVIINNNNHNSLFDTFSSSSGMGNMRNGKTGFLSLGSKSGKLRDVLNNIEKIFIQQTLRETNNRSEAIKRLGVSRRTFYYKIRKYKLL
jgi:transcriptional regulator with PAS, ATPase and Fis domain